MGRNAVKVIWKYFEAVSANGKLKSCVACGKEIQYNHGNTKTLENRLKTTHPVEFAEFQKQDNESRISSVRPCPPPPNPEELPPSATGHKKDQLVQQKLPQCFSLIRTSIRDVLFSERRFIYDLFLFIYLFYFYDILRFL
ncbi:MAG: hypothetical protein GY820_08230 [Gammaproteobacteria bacterium]|nr:hypothetical protein [Gammaproteobacteria bacterium]